METLIFIEKNIIEVKRAKTKILALKQKSKALRCIMIKYILFLII